MLPNFLDWLVQDPDIYRPLPQSITMLNNYTNHLTNDLQAAKSVSFKKERKKERKKKEPLKLAHYRLFFLFLVWLHCRTCWKRADCFFHSGFQPVIREKKSHGDWYKIAEGIMQSEVKPMAFCNNLANARPPSYQVIAAICELNCLWYDLSSDCPVNCYLAP